MPIMSSASGKRRRVSMYRPSDAAKPKPIGSTIGSRRCFTPHPASCDAVRSRLSRSAGVSGKTVEALTGEADALADLGVTMLTVGVNGPDYDLSEAEALVRWRDRRQNAGG